MRRIRLLLGCIAIFALVALPMRARAADELYLRGGRLVDVGGFRLNLVCSGRGAPTVVFDAGLEDWSPSWSLVQPAVATTTRTCSFDRAGNGLSDPGPLPRTSGEIVSELHALLAAAALTPPYILVGHSFGGYTMRLFTDRYEDEVAGIVLVDSSHEDQGSIAAAESPHYAKDWQAMLAGLRACQRLAAAQPPRWSRSSKAVCTGQFFRGLPERRFSARLNAKLLREASAAKQYAASLAEAQSFSGASARELRLARRPFGSLPLRILTATQHFVDRSSTPIAQRRRERRFEREWQGLQRRWLGLSSNARQTLAVGSGHYIQLDRPQLVIRTIEEEIGLARHSLQGDMHAAPSSDSGGRLVVVKPRGAR